MAFSGLILAGLYGIENNLKLEDPLKGNIYQNKNEDEVSWFQKTPNTSIEIINSIKIKKESKIIDVGSGRSRLFKNLIEQGYNNLTYLDISESAAKKSKIFLGEQSKNIEWIVEDVLNYDPKQNFDVWHDRAVFHFLTDQNQIKKYVDLVSRNISNNINASVLICNF